MNSVAQIEYREIIGFPFYRATSDGFIESCRVRGSATKRSAEWTRLRAGLRKDGYLFVCMSNESGEKNRKVHRVICEAFHGQCPAGMECCHNDGTRTNNIPNNLRWGTRKENASDRTPHGTERTGEKNHFAKLTERDVLRVRQLRRDGVTRREVAAMFGIHKEYVTDICTRKNWKATA